MEAPKEDNKTFRPIAELHEWQDNPRNITPRDYDRLMKQIKRLGQYKPLIVTPDGEVLGGNMRLKAYRELGMQNIWVSEVYPANENEKLEYALSDNDRAGYYDEDLLANMMPNYTIDWSQYAIDLKPPVDINTILENLGDHMLGDNTEVDVDALDDDLNAECPRCHFRFKHG